MKRKKADEDVKRLNESLEKKMKTQQKLNNGMRRLGLRNLPGKKPQWRWNKDNGKLGREGTGGID